MVTAVLFGHVFWSQGHKIILLVLSREYGNIFHRDDIGIIFPHSLLRTSICSGFGMIIPEPTDDDTPLTSIAIGNVSKSGRCALKGLQSFE